MLRKPISLQPKKPKFCRFLDLEQSVWGKTVIANFNFVKILKTSQPLQICIGSTIRIGRESWCLPYAGFLSFYLKQTIKYFLI